MSASTTQFLKKLKQISISNVRSGILCVLCALLLFAVLTLGIDQVFPKTRTWFQSVTDLLTLSPILIAVLVVLSLIFLIPYAATFIRGWGAWRRIVLADIFIASLLVFGVYAARYSARSPHLLFTFIALAIISGVSLLLRAAVSVRGKADGPKATLFDQVLNVSGLGPLEDFSQDELERGPLLQSLVELIGEKRQSSLTFGLDGAWGSGKTSILNALAANLASKGYHVVRFGAWDYREPDRIVRAYFDKLEATLSSHLAMPGLKRKFYRLAAGLAELGSGSIFTSIGRILSQSAEASAEQVRKDLKVALNEIDSPIVVLVDDLDRIESAELQAILRAIRLVSDLPNLTHVLSYDRQQLSVILFPEDVSGVQARDYLGKIVNIEFSMGNPPTGLAAKILENSLGPLWAYAGKEIARGFVQQLQKQPLSYLIEALPTPREIRRVAAATAWLWDRMGQHLNLFDLFILSVIQYRHPKVYQTMRTHPEWFTAVDWWTENPWAFAHRDAWKRESKKFFDSLSGTPNPSDTSVLRLLTMLLPGLVEEDSMISSLPKETEARKDRRLLHPLIYDRYFHLYIPPSIIPESEMEQFAFSVRENPEGRECQKVVSDRILNESARGRIESFWKQWEIVFPPSDLGYSLARDLSIGIASASVALSDEDGFLRRSDRRQGASIVLRLAASRSSSEESTRLLEDVVNASTSIDFAGHLTRPTKARNSIFKNSLPDGNRIESAFDALVRSLIGEDTQLTSLSQHDLGAIVFVSGDRRFVDDFLKRALTRNPRSLPSLLKLGAPQRLGTDEEPTVIEDFSPDKLAELIPVSDIATVTANLPLEEWSNEVDRELVRLFREWIQSKQVGAS